MKKRALAGAFVAALAITGAACGDDDDDTTESGSPDTTEAPDTTAAPEDEAEGEVVEITAVDYGYEGVPETVAPGTRFSLTNSGDEPHEMVAFLIPEGEDRPINELVALSDEELGAVFGGEPEPAFVILAATGQTDVPGPVVGDGTVSEPGRYGVVCFLPVGSTDEILESEGPPEESDAPPHAAQGMFAEFTVE